MSARILERGRSGQPSIVGIVALLLALAVLSDVDVSRAAISAGTIEQIDRHISTGIEANGIPGAALGIVEGDRVVHLRGFGDSGGGGHPITPGTPFVTASVTKSFTALAAVQLAEAGRLELDAPVTRYLPWFRVSPDDQTARVTVRTLLNQTSGIGTSAGGDGLRYLSERPIEETARELTGTPLSHPPGNTFEYANGNFVLLGAVIERASGRSYGDYLTAKVLRPLGMTRTFVAIDQAQRAGVTPGHRYWFGWTRAHTSWTPGLLPAGGLISTASDMSRYMRMMLNGGVLEGVRVLSPSGIATLLEPGADATVGPWAKDPGVAYGMGWYIGGGPFGPREAAFHPGGSPDFGSMVILLPQERAGVVVLMNATPEVGLPGAAGAVDRIPAGAASLLLDSQPKGGWSMHRFYIAFDVAVVLVLGALVWALVRTIRGPSTAARSRSGVVRRVVGASLITVLGALVLALPILSGVGWRVLYLSVPDLALVTTVVGMLLVALGLAHGARVLGPGATKHARISSQLTDDGDEVR